MPGGVDVSVLIPVLNEEAELEQVAGAMLAQELDGEAEFIFIDGGSVDASRRILAELAAADPRVRVLANPARRTPQALNIGLRAARGEFVARMDAHTIYPPRYLATGIARLRSGDVAWVSGPQLAIGTNRGSWRAARALSASLGKGGARYRDALRTEYEVDSGFTGVWRRETLENHHGWDEEWLNDQDLELAARIRKAGGRIICVPEMAAQYVPRDTFRRLARQYRTYGTYRVKTSRRHPETLRRSQLLPPAVTMVAASALIAPDRRLRRLGRAGLATYLAALIAAAARAGGRPSDRVGLPATWATMHLSYGVGFVIGCLRDGPPIRAVAASLGLESSARRGRTADTDRGRRLAVYTDYRYKRLGGRLYAERAFALFLIELGRHVDRLTIVGKVDPEPGQSHYPIGPEIDFAELDYFAELTAPVQLLRSASRSTVRFWRMLDEIDAVWLLGPHPLAVVFSMLAAVRGRRVTLGVRQDFRRYVRARHPGRAWVVAAGDVLEAIWRVLGRIVPVVAVGPVLAGQYPSARTLELVVSLVRESELRPADEPVASYDADRLTALSVGRLEEEKNPLLLADILALLVAVDPRWHLVICGEGPFEDLLRDRLVLLGVAEHAELRGYVPNDDGLRELYRHSHALLHVSWTEGLPQVLFEAFAARLPVVATAVGGVPDAAGDAALLVAPGDAASAVQALRRLAADSALRARLIEAGDRQVRAHTLDAEAAKTAAFLMGDRYVSSTSSSVCALDLLKPH